MLDVSLFRMASGALCVQLKMMSRVTQQKVTQSTQSPLNRSSATVLKTHKNNSFGSILDFLRSGFVLSCVKKHISIFDFTEGSGKKVLRLVLTEPACFDNLEGSRVIIKFSSSLDILRAIESVYGQAKNRVSGVADGTLSLKDLLVNLSRCYKMKSRNFKNHYFI